MLRSTLIAFFAFACICAQAQQRVPIRGIVRDASTREPLAGATVRLADGSRGTYTARDGSFRLPIEPGSHRLSVSCIGYETADVGAQTGGTPVEVLLKPSSVRLSGVSVSADLSAEEVVRNAIMRKHQNETRLKTLSGLLYTKLSVSIKGNAFGAIPEQIRDIITETFSRYWYDRDKTPDTRVEVVQRRQTANIPSNANLIALGNFFSFYADEVPLVNARAMSPLADDAFSRYHFELVGRSTFRNELVYDIRIIPTTRVLPAFQGSMKIVKGSYSLVEIDVRPTEATAVAFARDLHFVQRFDRIADSTWWPMNLEIDGGATVEVVKGLATIDAAFRATSTFTEAVANQPLPDTVFATQHIITAAPEADSAKAEFWENNSLSELTDKEKQTYEHVDSLVAQADTSALELSGRPSASFGAVLDFNRVSGILAGGSVGVRFAPVDLGGQIAYAFSLKRALVQSDVTLHISRDPSFRLGLYGSAFSRLQQNTFDRFPDAVNAVAGLVFHQDYGDWYRQLGWSAGLRASSGDFRMDASYERSRQYSEEARVGRSIFLREPFRDNPPIIPSSYAVGRLDAGIGTDPDAITIGSSQSLGAGLEITALTGARDEPSTSFSAVLARGTLEIPTFGTGYIPMLLKIGLQAGIGSDNLPMQYQFRMPARLVVVAPQGHFLTAPIAHFGGNKYLAFEAEHNFSDIVWRWLGLPTYWGRGVEFIVSGAAATTWSKQYRDWQASPIVGDPGNRFIAYVDTQDKWYTEAGFGLGKIPTFISNVIFLRADARFGIGELARGSWGLAMTISSPF